MVCFGELLWDMLPSGKVAGGAPFNIVNRATSLGVKSYVISSVGQDELGAELLGLVKAKGNSTEYIQKHPLLPTSSVKVSVGSGGEPHYDIIYPVAWDDIVIEDGIIELVKHSKSFVYSSLGIRDERARKTLFNLLSHAQLKICDINLRDGHFEQVTIMKMVEHADVLRMNEAELAMVSKWTGLDQLDRREQMQALSDHYNFELVIATLGGEGAVCYSNGTWYVQPVFKVNVKDTVGAGDAFLASFISQYLKGQDIDYCLKFGCAIGGITASKHGGTPNISPKEIEEMLNQ